MKALARNGWPAIAQLLRYGAVGLATNFLGYLVYLLVTWLWLEPKAAVTLMYPIGVLAGYFGHARYSFRYEGRFGPGMTRYLLAHGIGYATNIALLYGFSDVLGFPHQAVQAAAIFVVAALLFALFRWWVFPRAAVAPASG